MPDFILGTLGTLGTLGIGIAQALLIVKVVSLSA